MNNPNNFPKSNLEVPLIIRSTVFVYSALGSRFVSIPLSFFIILLSYLIDCYNQSYTFLPPSGTLISGLGLILSIRHSYLSKTATVKDLHNHFDNAVPATNVNYDSYDRILKSFYKAKDESVGILLILFGAVLNYIATLIPLFSFCKLNV